MKILHLLASPYFSGPAQLVAELALAQRQQGHQVTVAVDRLRRQTPAEELAVPRFEALGLLDEGGLELSVKSSPVQVLRDLRTLHRRTADVVHSHFSHDHHLLRLARPPGAVRVRSIHAERSLRWTLPAADGFTVPVESWAERLPAARPRRVLRAPVGPEFKPATDLRQLRAELGISGQPLVGMVSTFQPSRRHALGLEAFRRLRSAEPGARLVLVGDGELAGALRTQVASLGLEDAAHFAGYQPQSDFVRWLSALDEVWILGLGNDFSARAAAQAKRCGVRVIAIAEGALADYADAVVAKADADAVVAASRGGTRREVVVADPRIVAADVAALYDEAKRAKAP